MHVGKEGLYAEGCLSVELSPEKWYWNRKVPTQVLKNVAETAGAFTIQNFIKTV